MTAYADHDAALVAHGIRLGGGGGALTSALHAAREPLTVDDLERIARPDIDRRATRPDDGFEHVGMCEIASDGGGYVIAAQWHGWFPGWYATRDVALSVYGYILGGECFGYIEDLAKRWGDRAVTAEDIQGLPVQ